jgi:hypothetical protein
MRIQVQEAIELLVGEILWSSGRAADLQWFQFGERRMVEGFKGKPKEVGQYALHVQCAWRIRQRDHVIVGSRDLYLPPDGSDEGLDDFNWDVKDGNLRDKRIADLFQNETVQFLVKEVHAAEAGSFIVNLESDYALDVFPDDSLADEHWRLFSPYSDVRHFVVKGEGLKTENL